MKGTKEEPRDGYSKRAIELLEKGKIRFLVYDVFRDPDVREILKEVSRWQGYP